MLFVRRAAMICGVIGVSAVVCADVRAQQPAATAATAKPPSLVVPPADAPGPDKFVGQWDYNAVESVNAATGRPEQAARSATQRRGGVPAAAPAGGGGRRGRRRRRRRDRSAIRSAAGVATAGAAQRADDRATIATWPAICSKCPSGSSSR